MGKYISPASYWGLTPDQTNSLPLGLRHSNNLFNIKYYKGAENNQAKWPGLMGPSVARDQGDPQMQFANVEDSGVAGAGLLRRKYDSGMRTPAQMIAGPMGWTPGRTDSAQAVASYTGVSPNADLKLDTPEGMRNFLPALATQEHGTWARDKLYNSDMFDRIAERATGAQFATGELPKLDLLKADGSNARRVWSDTPQRGDMSMERTPQVASFEQRSPQSQGQTPMAAPALTPYDGPSPDDVAMQRKLAMSLMQQGTSAEPVGHWTQALARVLQGGVGGMYQDTARQGEKQGTQGIVDMLQGQQNPTPVQLLSNPWTREAGMKTLVQAAKGPEYGKQGTIVQDGQGNFYAVQFNDKGETKYHKLQAGGQSPTGVMSSESGMQMNGGQGVAPTALQPSKGTKQIGSTVVDVATGKPISNVEEAIAGKEKAEEVGKVQGKFVGAFPKLEAGLQAWDRQAELTSKIIDRSILSIEKNGRYVAGIGAPLATLPETEARKLRNDLDTIKANIGFDKLQAMREASPTGGALGAVSDMENRLLQAVQGALDQSGDPKALSENLANIKQMLGALRLEKKQAFATDVSRFGGAARPQGAPPGAGIPAPVTPRLKFNPATGALE